MHLNRRPIIRVLLIAWLALQAAVPLARKFDLPRCRYHFARFSWAMFSKPALVYQVRLYKVDAQGRKAPIRRLPSYVRLRTLAPHVRRDYYRSTEEIKDLQARLLRHVVERSRDGDTYVVEVRWVRTRGEANPGNWSLSLSKADLS